MRILREFCDYLLQCAENPVVNAHREQKAGRSQQQIGGNAWKLFLLFFQIDLELKGKSVVLREKKNFGTFQGVVELVLEFIIRKLFTFIRKMHKNSIKIQKNTEKFNKNSIKIHKNTEKIHRNSIKIHKNT